jgi:cell wall-associated NlpC family hydrolase
MDRRLTPANARVAHVSLKGQVSAESFVEGAWARVIAPLSDLEREPGGARDRQLLCGARVLVLEREGGRAFVQAERDGYVGYLPEAELGPDAVPTHWVVAPATHLYPAPELKLRELAMLPFCAELCVVRETGAYSETDAGLYVPSVHLIRIGERAADLAAVAETFLGSPYLWGGNTRDGIDCSGLVQIACWACGIPCPGDTDLQAEKLGRALAPEEPMRRGDLVFWRGHVAIAVDEETLIHANAHAMAVSYEGLTEAISRILAAGEGPVTVRRRPRG